MTLHIAKKYDQLLLGPLVVVRRLRDTIVGQLLASTLQHF